VYQLITGLATFGDADVGVAYSAHVGGFITGLLLVRPLSQPDRVAVLQSRRRPPGWA
jgi:membrane associated rhomboid family serine protease